MFMSVTVHVVEYLYLIVSLFISVSLTLTVTPTATPTTLLQVVARLEEAERRVVLLDQQVRVCVSLSLSVCGCVRLYH
jgi:hypothetical protein